MATYGTTDRLTGGTASADTEYGAQVAALACDDNASTYWESTDSAFPHWWKYDFGAGVLWRIGKLTLTCATISDGIGIKNFTLQGSNDDSSYTVVYTGVTTNISTIQTFSFVNNRLFRYYKLNVTDDWETGYNYCNINEIQMFEMINQAGSFLLNLI